MAGQLISMALVHAGVGPYCFSPVFFDSLIKCHAKVHVPIDAVYDLELQSTLKNLMSVESVNEAKRLIADTKLEEIQELSGTLRVLRSISNVKDVVCEIAYWYALDRTRAAYESFKSGMACLGLLDAVVANSAVFQRVFCSTFKF